MMKNAVKLGICILLALASKLAAGDFRIEGKSFLLDGKPFQIRSGELHYSRVPRAEWANRIEMARAMGLNTICTYVFWNYHEPTKGEFDFSGEKDFIAFVKLCDQLGMKAIVRPGPYVCAEWDLGGLPAWLLNEPGINMRSMDPRYLDPAAAWMKRMGEMLEPLTVAKGGPLLMVQVENEYGHFGEDSEYMKALHQALKSGGYQGIVFTGDGPSQSMLRNGAIPGTLKAVNFGGQAEIAFGKLEYFRRDQPEFTSEFWVGWFDDWGSLRQFINTHEKLVDFEVILRRKASFNLYMFHGGTTRNYWTAGNWKNGYSSATCCHDWSALLDESGQPTEKYWSFRSMIKQFVKDEVIPEVPKIAGAASIGTIQLKKQCRLIDALPKGQDVSTLKTMEASGQTTGFIVYRTEVEGPLEGSLELAEVKDRVYVMLNGELQGISGRSTKNGVIKLKIPSGKHRLDLMVENMGRVCYGGFLIGERKGLSGSLQLGGKDLGPFECVNLTMQSQPAAKYEEIKDGETLGNMTLYRGEFSLGSPSDTWLDMRDFGRGTVWLNGKNLGRYWKVGPVQGIFIPGCWMKKGELNEIVVMELEAEKCPSELPTSAKPIWGNN
jgi:beta-galactosidase